MSDNIDEKKAETAVETKVETKAETAGNATISKQRVNATIPNVTELELPSGKVATFIEFKGKHVREATRIMDGDQSLFLFSIISVICRIDGEPVFVDQLDDMPGPDAMKLIGQVSGFF